ncbi:uncharacterized protein LOC111039126 [Myzus persicae]|uniref:uncharacterized protein LOC111039126 n=1 Tax=Myzus persicae TaxID=13164 RepID=UPI000B934F83|nr:uncharacterized protein LOC111039126 [Myzus persicae]
MGITIIIYLYQCKVLCSGKTQCTCGVPTQQTAAVHLQFDGNGEIKNKTAFVVQSIAAWRIRGHHRRIFVVMILSHNNIVRWFIDMTQIMNLDDVFNRFSFLNDVIHFKFLIPKQII